MAAELLLDTGALVSLLDRSQSRHAEFVKFFERWRRPVVSTEAVLTEATHLLARTPGEVRAAATAALKRHDRILAAFSILTIQFEEMRGLIRELRREHGRGVTVLAGGPHATADPRDVLREGADIVFHGEVRPYLVDAIERGMQRALEREGRLAPVEA